MNKLWYKITGISLIIIGIIYAIINIYFSFGGPTIEDRLYETGFGFLFSGLILILSVVPGIVFLKLKRQNKLTSSSMILILIGIVWIILVAVYEFVIWKPTEMQGLATLFYGIIPAGILYGVSILLLIINWFRNR